MDCTLNVAPSDFVTHQGASSPTFDATNSSLDTIARGPSLSKRVSSAFIRFVIVFLFGVGATLGWQSYGNVATAMIATTASPQLGWLAPQIPSVAQTPPDVITPIPAVVPSPEIEQLAVGLASVRQSVDQLAVQLAATQHQMADKVAKLQVDVGDKITKLQADEREILRKLSAALSRPVAAPAPKPAPGSPAPYPSSIER